MITQILAAQLCHGNGRGIGQPVDFVYHDGVDPPGADVGEQTLQTWPLDGAAREPAIVVAGSGRYRCCASAKVRGDGTLDLQSA